MGEAVVFFNRELANDFAYRCKQAGQLASKMRFLTAPWLGMLREDAWLQRAQHANRMAATLARRLTSLPGVELLYPVEANAVFIQLPRDVHAHLALRGWQYYTFIGQGAARFMCSWATTDDDVALLASDIQAALGAALSRTG
jgi:threonine aldolase